MRIIALSTLKAFLIRSPSHADAHDPVMAWYRQVRQADWASPADIKRDIRNVSILKDGRSVFNIAGNKYRIVVWINYPYRVRVCPFHRHPSAVRRHRRTDNMKTTMDIAPIKTKRDYRRALKDIEGLMDAKRNSPEGDRLDVLVTLVEAFEQKHYPLDLPDPVETIKYHMDQAAFSRATSFLTSAAATACTRCSTESVH